MARSWKWMGRKCSPIMCRPAAGRKLVDIGHPARDRVLDGDHGEAGHALAHGGKGVLEGGAGERLPIGIDLAAGDVRIGRRVRPDRR
jgi:hypothetical protein